MTPINAK
jgi:hypothetical protein